VLLDKLVQPKRFGMDVWRENNASRRAHHYPVAFLIPAVDDNVFDNIVINVTRPALPAESSGKNR
jgi:hypothetical protein